MKQRISRYCSPVFISCFAFVVFLSACSSPPTPLGPTLEDNPALLPPGLAPSYVEKTIGPNGGQIFHYHNKTLVQFQVPRGVLKEPTKISLQVQGGGRSTQIRFEPNGLHFSDPGKLKLSFPGAESDLEGFTTWVIANTDHTDPVPTQIAFLGREVTIIAQIPHFSTGWAGED